MKKSKTAISPTRSEDFPEWFQQVVKASCLADRSPVRGCMVIRPFGYAIWEKIQQDLDRRFKETGHENAYFPLLIPLRFMEREAEHVDGFAKECAVVTHHRLEVGKDGQLLPAGKLEEPYIIRPTSETIIGEMYSQWVNSYRDLPILINQWANIMRWEMRTRMFLRTSEFLWQEGHTAHATKEEGLEETMKMLEIYNDFSHDMLAIPAIKGEKTPEERFPGAVNTFTIEAMMQDGKALQAGTSHFMGQNFAKASNISFSNKEGQVEYAWTTSWGMSTRVIGGVIMSHSDDDGLVLPPKIAPKHIIIIPVGKNSEYTAMRLEYCDKLKRELEKKLLNGQQIKVLLDDRDIGGGSKFWESIKMGFPLRVEVGDREVAEGTVSINRRCDERREKQTMSTNNFVEKVDSILTEIQSVIYKRAEKYRDEKTVSVSTLDDFKDHFANESGFVECFASLDPKDIALREAVTKPLSVSARCAPLVYKEEEGTCLFTGKTGRKVIFAKAY